MGDGADIFTWRDRMTIVWTMVAVTVFFFGVIELRQARIETRYQAALVQHREDLQEVKWEMYRLLAFDERLDRIEQCPEYQRTCGVPQ